MQVYGWQSLPISVCIGTFVGLIVSLQMGRALLDFGTPERIGSVAGISITREMGPVITAFVIAGRVGASMAAEIGTMSVTEEVDALRSMGINPVRFLVVPRFVAGITMLPILTILSIYVGFWGGALIADSLLGVSTVLYFELLYRTLELSDLAEGLIKSIIFGGMISLLCCYSGLMARGGADAVGRATTKGVVLSLMMILATDFFIGRFFKSAIG
jgi:phospholipid/cholesterol/gamma-HCH transport system permease protein